MEQQNEQTLNFRGKTYADVTFQTSEETVSTLKIN
jgi:hypothetical protein